MTTIRKKRKHEGRAWERKKKGKLVQKGAWFYEEGKLSDSQDKIN
jgi:hypothetical protein